ncbi:MAG: imidazole glycerol phosphate synthase subunit HisH [Bacteroidetes bacterium]|nr:imidazole glycerol phosphate synthase subunit HisH [Bacteroidota bacterium]MBS1755876.1 imidazole glycerol phosphate synthase subunit HisH [Bacteroidota bacterium]
MEIAIIKYNAGNTQSVLFALQRLGYKAVVTDDKKILSNADKVIFPGVGNAGAAMQSLQLTGLDKLIPALTQPVLGVCVGMQLLCNYSEEANTNCLGIINTSVKKFVSATKKIPHMGWNTIYNFNSILLDGVKQHEFVYYVHSYYAALCNASIATTDYILPYSAMLQQDNFYGVQFHAEKSAKAGDKILLNFLQLT